MKPLIYFMVGLLFFTGCTKKQEKKENNGLVGKWRLTEVFVSPGGGGSWQPYASFDPVIIEFTSNGNFNYTPYFPKASLQFDRYFLLGNNILMSSTSNNNTETWYIHYIDNTRLDMSIYMCIESCAYRFVPV